MTTNNRILTRLSPTSSYQKPRLSDLHNKKGEGGGGGAGGLGRFKKAFSKKRDKSET